jgi:hypothetical protein
MEGSDATAWTRCMDAMERFDALDAMAQFYAIVRSVVTAGAGAGAFQLHLLYAIGRVAVPWTPHQPPPPLTSQVCRLPPGRLRRCSASARARSQPAHAHSFRARTCPFRHRQSQRQNPGTEPPIPSYAPSNPRTTPFPIPLSPLPTPPETPTQPYPHPTDTYPCPCPSVCVRARVFDCVRVRVSVSVSEWCWVGGRAGARFVCGASSSHQLGLGIQGGA